MMKKKDFFHNVLLKKNLVLVLACFIFAFGIFSYISLPKQEYPIINIPIAVITTVYPGASANDIEELVTKKIEDVAMATKGFDNVASQSLDGVSIVQVFFKLELSEYEQNESKTILRNKINDLKDTELPSGVAYVKFIDDIGDTAGLILSFSSSNKSNAELIQRADELKNILRKMDGVEKVELDGELNEEIEVKVDLSKLNRLNLSFAELSTLISYQNNTLPAGNIVFDSDKVTVNTSGKFEDIEEIKNIIVDISPDSGAVTTLKDISTIEKVIEDNAKFYKFNGKNAVILNLYYENGINVVSAGDKILNQVNEFKNTLPPDIEIDTVINLATDVNNSINNFLSSVLQAIVIVLVVIMIGMSLRNATIVAVAIPVSITVPFILMLILGIDVQFISLAALIIALGMVVDNVVVVSDAIQVEIDKDDDKLMACVNGVKSVAIPVLSATLTTISIFIMFYFLPGTQSIFIFSLPTIVITTLIASYAVSMFVTPVMCYLFMVKSKTQKEGKVSLLDKSKLSMIKYLRFALKHKTITLLVSFAIVIVSLFLLTTLKMEYMPKSQKAILDIKITTTNLNDIRKTQEAVEKVLEVVNEQEEVNYVLSSVGGAVPKYDFSAMPEGDFLNIGNVILNFDLSKTKRFKETSYFVEYLQGELNNYVPSCKILVRQLGVIPEVDDPIQLRITGDDFDKLNKVAAEIETLMKNTDGITNIYSNSQFKNLSYFVEMKKTSLNGFGLTKAQIQNELNIALTGRKSSVFRETTKEYPIVLKGTINSTDDLKNLMIKSNVTGSKHQIAQIADIGIKDDYPSITRYNGNRAITISAFPKTGYSSIYLQLDILKQIENLDLGDVSIASNGDLKQLYESLEGLFKGGAVGLMGMIIILYIQYYSFKRAFLVLSAIPFGFIGASFGLIILKPGFNLFSILGMLSLMGVVINNSLILVDFINKEIDEGISIYEACENAVSQRFRPILLSTITSVLGMLPLALGGNELFKGMSIAFMCGYGLSIFFTLIIVPLMYVTLNSKKA